MSVARRFKIAAAVFVPYLLLSLGLFWPLIRQGFSTRLPAGADAVLDTWAYRWLPFAIGHGHNPFFSSVINWPHGVNLLANTTQLALAALEWPITTVFGPITSFNVACLLAPPLSASAMYLLARAFTSRRWLAWIIGLGYGFGVYEITAVANFHLQLLFVPIPPLLFLALYDLLAGRRLRAIPLGASIALLLIVQFFLSTEVLVITVTGLAIAGLIGLALSWRAQTGWWDRLVISLLVAFGLSGVVLAYPAWFAAFGPGSVNGVETLAPQAYRADLLGAVVPSDAVWLSPPAAQRFAQHFANGTSENYSYLGIPFVLTLVVAAVLLWRNRAVVTALLTAVAGFLLSMGAALTLDGRPSLSRDLTSAVGAWGPERLMSGLPLFKDLVPSRFALLTAIGALVALCALADHLLTTPRHASKSWQRTTAVVALCAVCLIPMIPTLPLGELRLAIRYATPPAGMAQLIDGRVAAQEPVATYPYAWSDNMSPLLWQVGLDFAFSMPSAYFRVPAGRHHHVAFDGTYGYGTPTLVGEVLTSLERTGRAMPLTPALKAGFSAQLRSWHIHWLIASFSKKREPFDLRYLSELLGHPPVNRINRLALFSTDSS